MDAAEARLLVIDEVEALRVHARAAVRQLHERPEVGGQEYRSAELLSTLLEEAGYRVQRGVAGLPTAFRAETGEGRPAVGLVVEYDALPGIGHACGHHWSGVCSVTAALALGRVLEKAGWNGRVVALGTPDEEGSGGKIPMIAAGAFSDLDAALMVHAFDGWHLRCESLALHEFTFTFTGKPAHAAAAPWEGVNALDAVMLTFGAINCLRQHVQEGSRIHGIVTEGGQAANVIPDRSQARVGIRARTTSYLDLLVERVFDCARAGALATGCSLDIAAAGPRYESVSSSHELEQAFARNLRPLLSETELPVAASPPVIGSTDMGNLSRVVPAIHPMAAVAPPGTRPHTPEFAAAMVAPAAVSRLAACAKALACTVIDLLADPELGRRVQAEFTRR